MRLIDADAIPYTMLYKENFLAGTGYEAQAAWKKDIDAMPTIEERKKGKWIIEPHDVKNDIWVHRCGACLKVTMLGGHKPRFDFCPNCGADMRGITNG